MGRCYPCHQENCRNYRPPCDCSCHADERRMDAAVVDRNYAIANTEVANEAVGKAREAMTPQRWAVKHAEGWVHEVCWAMFSLCAKGDRDIFTDLRLARAVALVCGGRVFRVKG